MRFSFLSPTEKSLSILRRHFLAKMLEIFRNLLLKVWGIESWISFFSKCVTTRVEKINDRWRQYRQKKNAQKGWNWLMRPTLTQFLECSLAFMKKWKTLFDFKVCKEWVLQISSIYIKKCALKYLPK